MAVGIRANSIIITSVILGLYQRSLEDERYMRLILISSGNLIKRPGKKTVSCFTNLINKLAAQ